MTFFITSFLGVICATAVLKWWKDFSENMLLEHVGREVVAVILKKYLDRQNNNGGHQNEKERGVDTFPDT